MQQQTKLLPTMINFHETYQLMKSYLSKKRFSYVYEQCIKYYNKNQTFFCNHQVLMLIKIVFYVLKKKMISKFVTAGGKNWSIESVYEIYNVMTNVYLSWENVLMVQMNAQDTTFFQMIHRARQFKINKKHILLKRPQMLLFQSKKDFVVTNKINIQYKIYLYYKQCLRMVINTLMVMVSCLDISKVPRLVKVIQLGQQIIGKVQQHQFPLQKIQFYILKCQIIEFVTKKVNLCLNINIKYQFPVGFFQLIYLHVYKWKQAKLMHYVNLLFKMVCVSLRNQLMQIKDAYILVNQIKLLIFVVKKKDTQITIKRQSTKGRRGIMDIKSVAPHIQGKKQSNVFRKQIERRDTASSQTRCKTKMHNILKIILQQIDSYLNGRKQVAHILRVYMQGIYFMHKQNPTQKNDQIIDQIPTLIEKQNKIKRKQKNSNLLSPIKQDFNANLQLLTKKKSITFTQTFYGSKKQGHHDDEYGHESIIAHSQETKLKDNRIILKNIFNVKQSKKLSLSRKNETDRPWKNTKNSARTSTTQCSKNQGLYKFPFPNFLQQVLQKSFNQLKVFKPQINESLNLFQQSSSDSDNQMQYQFELKRRSMIQELNNKFYKESNPNYFMKEDTIDETDHRSQTKWGDTEQGEQQIEGLGIGGKKKISEDIQFDEIRLLDQVIKQRIFNYLDLQLINGVKDNQIYSNYNVNNSKRKGNKQLQKPPMITAFCDVLKSTQNLKIQVQQLNKKRKLIIDKLNYKKSTIKAYQANSSSQNQNFHSSVLKDLQNIYNTKNNLTDKAQKCVKLYRKLLKIDNTKNSTFDHVVKKYGNIYKKYNQQLSMIGQQQDDEQGTHRKSQQVPLLEYIVKNRPISLLQQTLKRKEVQSKFNLASNDKQQLQTGQKKQIALRQTFDNLRANISKSQFNESNSLTKNFTLKVQNLQ